MLAVGGAARGREVADSLSWRRFCRIGLDRPVPHPTTLVKLVRRAGPRSSGSSTGIALGLGAVWVANSLDNSVSRIDPNSGRVVDTIPVGGTPSGVAVGLGAVWVTNTSDNTVSRISPATGTVVRPIGVGNGPRAITVGPTRCGWPTA